MSDHVHNQEDFAKRYRMCERFADCEGTEFGDAIHSILAATRYLGNPTARILLSIAEMECSEILNDIDDLDEWEKDLVDYFRRP